MSFIIFIVVVIISFIIVRLGGIAFELTGMNTRQADFQALSCYTRCGFTTNESELIMNHEQRRRIAMILISLGNAASVTIIAALVSHLQHIISSEDGTIHLPYNINIPVYSPELEMFIKLLGFILLLFILYRFFMKSRFFSSILQYAKSQLKKMKVIEPVPFEQLVAGAEGYGISRIQISENSPLCNKTLAESNLPAKLNIQILAINRDENLIPTPKAGNMILPGDIILCFGKEKDIENNSEIFA